MGEAVLVPLRAGSKVVVVDTSVVEVGVSKAGAAQVVQSEVTVV